jgi:hypothetical protein
MMRTQIMLLAVLSAGASGEEVANGDAVRLAGDERALRQLRLLRAGGAARPGDSRHRSTMVQHVSGGINAVWADRHRGSGCDRATRPESDFAYRRQCAADRCRVHAERMALHQRIRAGDVAAQLCRDVPDSRRIVRAQRNGPARRAVGNFASQRGYSVGPALIAALEFHFAISGLVVASVGGLLLSIALNVLDRLIR